MIQLQVVGVTRRNHAQVATIRYKYHKDKPHETERTQGAEWEEVELKVKDQDEPAIQIGMVIADAIFITGNGPIVKLIINNPDEFGQYKMGDIIPLTVPITVKAK